MCLILTTKLWWPTIFRLHQHRVSLVIQRKQNQKCMLGSFRLAVHSHFAFVSALDEALLTLKSSPQGEFNTPAAFQWFSSHPFLLLFSSHSLMPRAPFGAEKRAKATPLKSFFLIFINIILHQPSEKCTLGQFTVTGHIYSSVPPTQTVQAHRN